jgi:hypothetical protein
MVFIFITALHRLRHRYVSTREKWGRRLAARMISSRKAIIRFLDIRSSAELLGFRQVRSSSQLDKLIENDTRQSRFTKEQVVA